MGERFSEKPVIDISTRKEYMYYLDKEGYVARAKYTRPKKLTEEELAARKAKHEKEMADRKAARQAETAKRKAERKKEKDAVVAEGKRLRADIARLRKDAKKTLNQGTIDALKAAQGKYTEFQLGRKK